MTAVKYINLIYQADNIHTLVSLIWAAALADLSTAEFTAVLSAYKARRREVINDGLL